MKDFKDIILEKLKVTTNDKSEFNIEKITSEDLKVLTFMLGDIPFYMFDYEKYINNILETDIVVSPKKLKDELYYHHGKYSKLKDCLPKFLNNILTIMNTSKPDHIKYNLQQFIKEVNKFFARKELLIKINYSYLGVNSEKYILVIGAKDVDFTADDILNIEISK